MCGSGWGLQGVGFEVWSMGCGVSGGSLSPSLHLSLSLSPSLHLSLSLSISLSPSLGCRVKGVHGPASVSNSKGSQSLSQ